MRRADVSLPPQAGSHWDIPEERVKISWVTIDRYCQEEADAKENVRRELEHAGNPLRSSADSLSDDELLTKLAEFRPGRRP